VQDRIQLPAVPLPRPSARKPRLEKIRKQLELPENSLLGFSSMEPIGHEDVWRTLLGIIG
jgi:hypothetical protein